MLKGIFIGLLLFQGSTAESAKNPHTEQQQTVAQSSPTTNSDRSAEASKDEAFKTEQLHRNGIVKPIRYINRTFRFIPDLWDAITKENRRLFLVVSAEYGDLNHKRLSQMFRYVYYPSNRKFGDYDIV